MHVVFNAEKVIQVDAIGGERDCNFPQRRLLLTCTVLWLSEVC